MPRFGTGWTSYRARFDDGSSDLLAILPKECEGGALRSRQIKNVWLLLRETCISSLNQARQTSLDSALLRLLSDRIGMSIVVLDGRCRILRMNSAGRALLERGDLLVTTGKGLGCRSRKSTLKLRQAVHECLADDGDASIERVVILEPRDGKGFVPIFLRRFEAVPEARMVIAMLPMPPKDERIEFLARKMGLTRSEARIAALMRRGLSNKEMASIARLTEQTCSTYSKRVLSKLNVGRRAEIAQLLTWQSA